jgi:hypothetical protein
MRAAKTAANGPSIAGSGTDVRAASSPSMPTIGWDRGMPPPDNSESPEFIGRAVAALAADPDVIRHSGGVRVAAQLAMEYGFRDIDGKVPHPLALADV